MTSLLMLSTSINIFQSFEDDGKPSQSREGRTALNCAEPEYPMLLVLQENLKHTLPSDSYDLIPDTSLDLRVGYEAQQINWLCFQRILQASLPEYLQDRPVTLSSLLVRIYCRYTSVWLSPTACTAWLPAGI